MTKRSKRKNEKRIIAIGDVHGCATELEELLELLQPSDSDVVIFVGDLINKGPNNSKVLTIANELNAIYIRGNHEQRLLQYKWLEDVNILKSYDKATIATLSDSDWEFMAKSKLYHYEKSIDTLFVHAGLLPDIPWKEQTISTFTRIQVINAQGEACKRSESPKSPHWSRFWKQQPFVVYGHTPSPKIRRTPYSLGIDTACVYGEYLTACVFPEKKIYQVKAHRAYTS
jgi:predicted phosphodiesterase